MFIFTYFIIFTLIFYKAGLHPDNGAILMSEAEFAADAAFCGVFRKTDAIGVEQWGKYIKWFHPTKILCQGILLDESHVILPALCRDMWMEIGGLFSLRKTLMRFGVNEINRMIDRLFAHMPFSSGKHERDISSMDAPPQWYEIKTNDMTLNAKLSYNIAIATLSSKFGFKHGMKKYPEFKYDFGGDEEFDLTFGKSESTNKDCKVYAWKTEDVVEGMRWFKAEITTMESCRERVGGCLAEDQFCARSTAPMMGFCKMYLGSPIVCTVTFEGDDESHVYVVGVLTDGDLTNVCKDDMILLERYMRFTRLDYHIEWIDEILGVTGSKITVANHTPKSSFKWELFWTILINLMIILVFLSILYCCYRFRKRYEIQGRIRSRRTGLCVCATYTQERRQK